MRKDMQHVVMNGGSGSSCSYRRRRQKNKKVDENAPRCEGMRRHNSCDWTSRSNYSLAPLFGWLDKQVGRPWGKVRGEAMKAFRRDAPFKISSVITWHVELHVQLRDGVPYKERWGRISRLNPGDLYVCPKTGLLRRARNPCKGPKPIIIPAEKVSELGNRWHAIKRDGVWWRIRFERLPEFEYRTRWDGKADGLVDAFLGAVVNLRPHDFQQMYGRKNCYCVERKQMSRREMKKHDLWRQ